MDTEKVNLLVNKLREILPNKIDYADLVCGELGSHGICYVWEHEESYIIDEAANTLEGLVAEVDRLNAENEALRHIIASMNLEPETYAANGLRVKVVDGRVTAEYEGGEKNG